MVAKDPQFLPRILRATFSAVDTGVLLVQKGGNVSLSRLIWFDREGKELGTVGEAQVYANPKIAAKGQQVVVDQTDPENQNTDIWTYDVEHGRSETADVRSSAGCHCRCGVRMRRRWCLRRAGERRSTCF